VVVVSSGSRTDLAPPCSQSLARSLPVCKIRRGSGGFVGFLRARIEVIG
jgi:hypothetical protein